MVMLICTTPQNNNSIWLYIILFYLIEHLVSILYYIDGVDVPVRLLVKLVRPGQTQIAPLIGSRSGLGLKTRYIIGLKIFQKVEVHIFRMSTYVMITPFTWLIHIIKISRTGQITTQVKWSRCQQQFKKKV